jgi:recombinational DNA repair protein RecT
LNKEIWCYKDNRGNLIIFAGRDGMLKKAQQNIDFNGLRSCEIREGDEGWKVDVPNGAVVHTINKPLKERGRIIGAYAFAYRKDGEATLEWVEFDTYAKDNNIWKSVPADMIKKTAESKALKKAFGLSGVQLEDDWKIEEGVALPISTEKDNTVDPVQQKQMELIEALEQYQGEDIDEIRDRCGFAQSKGELTIEFMDKVINEMKGTGHVE